MNIIIVGIGKVGYTVAEQLTAENHNVTVIDKEKEIIEEIMSDLDVIGIVGNGASSEILKSARVDDCQLVIASTGNDEVNLICCLLAKKLGAKDTIARVRTPEYNDDLSLLKESMGVGKAVNPEKEAADEILRILKFPNAKNVDIFAKGKIDLFSFVADENCSLCGRSIKESFMNMKAEALVCAVKRGENSFIPSGDFVIEENDTVAALASRDAIEKFFKEIGFASNDVKDILIIGGGRIAHYLAASLESMNMNTTIIEKDKDIAESLSISFPNSTVICGDGTNRSLLLEEGLKDIDAICCLTGFDEENILLSLFAKSVSKNIKTISKVNKIAFQEVTRILDIGSVVYPKYITASFILQQVRAHHNKMDNNLEKLYKIVDNTVEALEFKVSEKSQLVNKTLEELNLKKNVILGCINRGGKVFIPHGPDTLQIGDNVIVVTTTSGLSDLDDIEG